MTQFRRLCVFGAILLSIGCSNKPDDSASGEELYHYHCAGCHKDDGHGRLFRGIPANTQTRLSQASVIHLITEGRHDKPGMPALDELSYTEARKITAYVWQLKQQTQH